MKRTFTVTVEGLDDHETIPLQALAEVVCEWSENGVALECVETTSVHHAERMVINRALIWDAPGFSEKRTPKLQQAVRELRALMEGNR